MEYQLVNQDFVKGLEGQDDPLLNNGLVIRLAEGRTNQKKTFTITLTTAGKVKAHYKYRGDTITLCNEDLIDFFYDNEALNKAVENGSLDIIDSNWYELQFEVNDKRIDTPYIDIVGMLLGEIIDTIKTALADKQFVKTLDD